MSSSPPPADHSVELAAQEAKAQEAARQAELKAQQEQRARFESSLGSAYNGSISDAQDFFTQRGLDPNEYISAIQQGATSARSKVPDLAASPGTYFDNLGATVYDRLNTGKRAEYQRAINKYAPSGFESNRIGDTSDDALQASILAEQRQTAEGYIRNLLDRGVITSGGFSAANKNLDSQAYGAKSRLEEVGNTLLNKGRGDASGEANKARQAAAAYELGDSFDPYSYNEKINNVFSGFFANLGNNFRAAAPMSLFDTSGLAGIAGAAAGAQNTKFNPNALAGVIADGAETDDPNRTNTLSAF